jgi:sugar phosphate permease
MTQGGVERLKKIPFFYGWVIVAISFITLAVGYGSRASFSVFLVAILEEYGWSRGAISGAFALHMLVAGVGLPAVGALVDRYGPRILLPSGAAIMAFGMWRLGGLQELWHFYVFYGLVMALGRIMIAMTPHTAIISNWFIKKRGTAMGLAGSGIGIGSVLIIPLVQYSLSRFGWRDGCALIALMIFLVLCPLTAFFQRLRPDDMGLAPDGETLEKEPVEEQEGHASKGLGLESWTVSSAVRTSRYWLLFFAFFFSAMINMVDMHQIAYLVDVGFTKKVAAMIFASVGLIRALGVFCGGALSDRIGREQSFTVGVSFLITGIIMLLRIREPSHTMPLAFFVLCYGFGNGFRSSVMPSITADVFHGKRVGSIYGTFATAMTCGAGLGPWLAGHLYDVTGRYTIPFLMVIAFLNVACVLVWIVAPRKARNKGGTR